MINPTESIEYGLYDPIQNILYKMSVDQIAESTFYNKLVMNAIAEKEKN